MTEERLVPDDDEQKLVLEGLTALLRGGAWVNFVRGPVVLPDERFFPDRWAGGQPSVARVLRRLLHYAGIDDLEVDVTIYDEDSAGKPGVTSRGPGSGVWFDGIAGRTSRFSVDAQAMREPKPLVAGLARAVTEAWIARRGKKLPDERDADARFERHRTIDLATVVLGFGVLTTDATVMHHARAAGGFRATRTQTRLGVSPPQVMAFALAVQAACREAKPPELRAWQKHLQANQGAFLRESAKTVARLHPRLRERLGIPEVDAWPPVPELDLEPFDDEAGDSQTKAASPEERLDEDRGILGKNAGKPVFRIERTMAPRVARVTVLAAILIAVMSRGLPGLDLPVPQLIAGVAALGLVGLLVGRFFLDVRCSEPKCGARLAREDEVCPSCGGTVRGAIKHPRERLAAEEALSRSAAGEIGAEGPELSSGEEEYDQRAPGQPDDSRSSLRGGREASNRSQ